MAQVLPGNYTSSWVGNTWGGIKFSHVQNYIERMTVTPDGTVYCNAGWDEAHWDNQKFKDGESLCANCSPEVNTQQAGSWSINGSNVVGNGKTISLEKPTAIALNPNNNNQLIIGESGQKRQILIYDVSGTPTLIDEIGAEGGPSANLEIDYDITSKARFRISGHYPAGNYRPGAYHPLKFWAFTGVGMDNEGRIFMAYNENSTGIKCFRKIDNKWYLDWDIMSMHFVDVCDFDRAMMEKECMECRKFMILTFLNLHQAVSGH
ncbi:MAG: hypothetical protein HC906_10930 [Bacteroidales bacterium]|nr:hypothetical protein [Bacteroidales bacterium]